MTGGAFEAVADDIEKSAAGMTSAGETIGAADPTADLSKVSGALSGGASAAAATSLATTWTTRFTTWSTDAKQHGSARLTSSRNYTAADHAASLELQRAAWGNRGPAMAQDR